LIRTTRPLDGVALTAVLRKTRGNSASNGPACRTVATSASARSGMITTKNYTGRRRSF
jgi:hypothetical protein